MFGKGNKIVSLGPNCGIFIWMKKNLHINRENMFFDKIGMPIGNQIKLLKNPKPIKFKNNYFPDNTKEALKYSYKKNTSVEVEYKISLVHYKSSRNTSDLILTNKLNDKLNKFYKNVLYNSQHFIVFFYYSNIHKEYDTSKWDNESIDLNICKSNDNFEFNQNQFEIKKFNE